MRVIRGWRSDPERLLTDPLPEKRWSLILRFYGGDHLDPVGIGTNWFIPPFPQHVMHLWWPLWLSYVLFAITSDLLLFSTIAAAMNLAELLGAPIVAYHGLVALCCPIFFLLWLMTPGKMIAWRFNKNGGYAGSKVYGVDAEIYGEWLCDPKDIYPGSLAMCLSIRPWATISD